MSRPSPHSPPHTSSASRSTASRSNDFRYCSVVCKFEWPSLFLDTADSFGADVTLAPQFGPARGVLSGSVYRSVTDGGSIETGLGSDGLVYTVRGNVQAEVVPGLTVQAFGFYRGPIETEDGRISPFGFGSLGGSYKLSDRLTLSANVNDVLGTAQFSFETGTDDYRFVGERVLRLRQATATLTYTFGQAGPPRPRPQAQPQGGGLDSIGI